MQTYVDDPGTTIGGVQRDRRRIITLMVLALRAINVRLAFRKGQLGVDVAWIGFGYRIRQAGVQVYVLPETFEDLCKLIAQVAASNIVGIKTLRTLAGKLSNIARMLRSWKPFLACFWGGAEERQHGHDGRSPTEHGLEEADRLRAQLDPGVFAGAKRRDNPGLRPPPLHAAGGVRHRDGGREPLGHRRVDQHRRRAR